MSAPLAAKRSRGNILLDWLPVIIGLLVLYGPTFYDAATTFWRSDENAHGPIILAIIGWLFWRKRAALFAASPHTKTASGVAVLVIGLLLYVVGRSQGVAMIEIGSLSFVLIGVVLATRGRVALHAAWFPILFVAFMLPIPGLFVDALTGPLKQYVSEIAEQLLYTAGYPIARNGVVISIGQYQLLVADACSGLNSMFSLTALGFLYLHLRHRQSWLHNGLILACILPIAFAANIFRVLVLILITYHFGDEAGQSFLHWAAGIVLLIVSLITLLLLDCILARVIKSSKSVATGNGSVAPG